MTLVWSPETAIKEAVNKAFERLFMPASPSKADAVVSCNRLVAYVEGEGVSD